MAYAHRALRAVALCTVVAACSSDEFATAPSSVGDGGCSPAAIDRWTPTWKPPKTPQPGACTEALLASIASKCESSPGDTAGCYALKTSVANTACLDCLYSAETDPTYGAIVIRTHAEMPNYAGCMALIDHDQTSTGCGPQVQAAEQCAADACSSSCSRPTSTDYDACLQSANDGPCNGYKSGLICASKPAYTVCWSGATFADTVVLLGRIFCAGGLTPTDGGAGAGD